MILYTEGFLIKLSKYINKLRRNANVDYILEGAGILDGRDEIKDLYNKDTITFKELKDAIGRIKNSKPKDVMKRINSLEVGDFCYSNDFVYPKTPYAFNKGIKEFLCTKFDQLAQIVLSKRPNRYSIDNT